MKAAPIAVLVLVTACELPRLRPGGPPTMHPSESDAAVVERPPRPAPCPAGTFRIPPFGSACFALPLDARRDAGDGGDR